MKNKLQVIMLKIKKRSVWELGIVLSAAMAFWGMIYPDLCFTSDVCIQINGAGRNYTQVSPETEEQEEKDMFTRLCESDADSIMIRSGLADYLLRDKVSEDTQNHLESKGKKYAGSK